MRRKFQKVILFIIILIGIISKNIYAINEIESDKVEVEIKEDEKVNALESKKSETLPIEEGYYIIKSALNQNKVLDIDKVSKDNGANIQLWDKNKGTNQIFEVILDSNTNTYKIKSALSGKILDIHGGSKKNCANVELYDDNNSNWQKWIISKTADNYYSIKSFHSGLYLDATGNVAKNGTNIEVYEGNGGKNQKFIFEKVIIPKNTKIIDEGFYQIKSAVNNNKVVDVFWASKEDKANVRNIF